MHAPLTEDAALSMLTPEPGLVVLMCGVAGSGKTSFSLKLASKGFARLSIDEEIWARFGRYGLDYAPEQYPEHVATARETLKDVLLRRLAARQSVVVDSSFWSRAHRDDFKELVEVAGGAWLLVYLKAPEPILRDRLEARSRRFDANAAFPIGVDLLAGFLESFQAPIDEGEMVVTVT